MAEMPHYRLPAAVERHYEDVKGAEHRRLLQQQALAKEIRRMQQIEAAAEEERRRLFTATLPALETQVHRFAVEIANTRSDETLLLTSCGITV